MTPDEHAEAELTSAQQTAVDTIIRDVEAAGREIDTIAAGVEADFIEAEREIDEVGERLEKAVAAIDLDALDKAEHEADDELDALMLEESQDLAEEEG